MTTTQARNLLGAQSKGMSDEDIQALLGQFYDLAEVIANTLQRHDSNERTKGIDALNTEVHNKSRIQ